MLVMEKVIFKCYSELDTPENMLIIGGNQIKNISSQISKGGKSKLIINYYDDELCFITFFICDKIEAIDIETDSDYQIWRNS